MTDKLGLIREIFHDLGYIHSKLKEEGNTLAYLSLNMALIKLDDFIKQYEIDKGFNDKVKHHLDFNGFSFDKKDPIVEQVIDKFRSRSQEGIKKYGTTLADNKLTQEEWLNHLQEELMDAVVYLERLKQEL